MAARTRSIMDMVGALSSTGWFVRCLRSTVGRMGDRVTLPSVSVGQIRRSGREFRTSVAVLVALVALAASVSRVLRRGEVAGDSMLPVLIPGDRLLVLCHPRWRWQ